MSYNVEDLPLDRESSTGTGSHTPRRESLVLRTPRLSDESNGLIPASTVMIPKCLQAGYIWAKKRCTKGIKTRLTKYTKKGTCTRFCKRTSSESIPRRRGTEDIQ